MNINCMRLREKLEIPHISAPRTIPSLYNLGNILKPSSQLIYAVLLEIGYFSHGDGCPMDVILLSLFGWKNFAVIDDVYLLLQQIQGSLCTKIANERCKD